MNHRVSSWKGDIRLHQAWMYLFLVGKARAINSLKCFIWRGWCYMTLINTKIIKSERMQSGWNLISVLIITWYHQPRCRVLTPPELSELGEDPMMREKIQFPTTPSCCCPPPTELRRRPIRGRCARTGRSSEWCLIDTRARTSSCSFLVLLQHTVHKSSH